MTLLSSSGTVLADAGGHALAFGELPSLFALTAAPSGGWSWFADPRAVYSSAVDKTFFGYDADISGNENLEVRSYDHATRTVSSPFVLHVTASDAEDHGPPTLLRRASDGRLRTFYHNNDTESVIYTRLSTNPDDVSAWDSQVDITSQIGGAGGTHYFFNPMQLTGETGSPIYLFYTGYATSQPRLVGYSTSTDGGTTWAANTSVYVTSLTWSYFKVTPNGTTRIDFAVTDNHPKLGATSLYHFYYQGGSYYQSDGTLITASLPFDQTALTRLYDGSSISGWVWDIAIEPATGYPIVVFATFPTTSDHRYQYARWTGSAWSVHQICTAGTYFATDLPHDPGMVYYSGGVYLDHNTPNVVYASRNVTGQWEISKFITTDGGATWSEIVLTTGSTNPQVRPIVPRSRSSDLTALWLNGTYGSYNSYDMGLQGTSL